MLLEISLRYWGVTRERHNTTQKSTGKAAFTSAEGCGTDKEQAHIARSLLGFYLSNAAPPLNLAGFGFPVYAVG
jgi:hypothetical protein